MRQETELPRAERASPPTTCTITCASKSYRLKQKTASAYHERVKRNKTLCPRPKGHPVPYSATKSEAVHEFVQVVAKSRASGGPGRVGGPKGEVAKLVGQVRRQLGVAAVKVQARLLLERLQLVGQRAPAQQAQVAAAAAEWQRRELEAADRAAREGVRGVHRGGQPLVGVGA